MHLARTPRIPLPLSSMWFSAFLQLLKKPRELFCVDAITVWVYLNQFQCHSILLIALKQTCFIPKIFSNLVISSWISAFYLVVQNNSSHDIRRDSHWMPLSVSRWKLLKILDYFSSHILIYMYEIYIFFVSRASEQIGSYALTLIPHK